MHYTIKTPTLVVDETKVRSNIKKMAAKAKSYGLAFRPHFKTHQSRSVGEWFKEEGIDRIAVSSLRMAEYFAHEGWEDICVAIPVNILEINTINRLASKVKLGIVIDHIDSLTFLEAHLTRPVQVWIKLDCGYKRAGVHYSNISLLETLAKGIEASDNMHLAGLMVHSGQTYHTNSVEEVRAIHKDATITASKAKNHLQSVLLRKINLSMGDTPSASLGDYFTDVDELRVGCFVFYDLMQANIHSCTESEIAIAAACPVIGIYPEREEMVIYGGAVHLSKDFITDQNGDKIFGKIVDISPQGWDVPEESYYIRSISQEHGIVKAPKSFLEKYKIGDLVGVLPVHCCLTADNMKWYLTLEGEHLDHMIGNI